MRTLKRILTRLCHQVGVQATADNAADIAWGIMKGKKLSRDLCRNAKRWKHPKPKAKKAPEPDAETAAAERDERPR